MNDGMKLIGLVSPLLISSAMQNVFDVNNILPNQTDRMRALEAARAEIKTGKCQLRIQKELQSNLQAAMKCKFKVEKEFVVYREKERS